MNWIERWQALSARILGLMDAGNFLIQALQVNSSDTRALTRLIDEWKQIHGELTAFKQEFCDQMPPLAAEALLEFCREPIPEYQPGAGAVTLQPMAQLQIFCARFTYLIRDSEIEGRNVTELAFEHLRRLIVVDEEARTKWQSAFNKNEVACEKRGAVHLLTHGVWAFKVQGTSEATDLVYGEPLNRTRQVLRRTARVIVLTEWKRVRSPDDADAKAAEARRQTNEYAAGVLGDLELKRTRYIVLVGERQQTPPSDLEEKGILTGTFGSRLNLRCHPRALEENGNACITRCGEVVVVSAVKI
jgi:hypothetical protein